MPSPCQPSAKRMRRRRGQGGALAHFEPTRCEPGFASRAAEHATTLTKLKVLRVEDKPDALDLFTRGPSEAGADVHPVRDGRAAFDAYETAPHLIITDIGMPEADGSEAAESALQGSRCSRQIRGAKTCDLQPRGCCKEVHEQARPSYRSSAVKVRSSSLPSLRVFGPHTAASATPQAECT